MSSKKYQSEILQDGDSWTARITRQVTSRKSLVSKQQEAFTSEAEAQAWVETNMAEFISTQKNANSRQGSSRKDQQEIKLQRSSRRAEKTAITKREKAAEAEKIADGEKNAGSEKKDAVLAKRNSEETSDLESDYDSYDD